MTLLKYWDRLRSSFWFLPTLMTVATFILVYATVSYDEGLEGDLPDVLKWAYTGGADGASVVLGTIAGSMITIAGVVFSLTLIALSLASSQFGPRLLRNFMRDTTNQVVIGTFISTFIYCLLVLRTIRHEDDISFVPQFSVTLGVGFALLSLGVLIYFIHHVAVSIQADEIIARVTEELAEGIERLFPEQLGEDIQAFEALSGALPADFDTFAAPVVSDADGYVQFVDAGALMSVATDNDLILDVHHRPGQYVVEEAPLVFVYPAAKLDDSIRARLQEAFVLGDQRTAAQDVEFSLSQLVEIAVRAMSPGVNDPFTAIACIDRLGSALCRLARRQMPSPYRRDQNDSLRVCAPAPTFPALLDASFDQIRQCARTNVAITIRLLDTIIVIAPFVVRTEDSAALSRQAEMIVHAIGNESCERGDLQDIEERYVKAQAALEKGNRKQPVRLKQ